MLTTNMLKESGEILDYSTYGRTKYVQSDTLLLADIFESFKNKYLKVYKLDPDNFLSAPRLAWQACLKKNKNQTRISNRCRYESND